MPCSPSRSRVYCVLCCSLILHATGLGPFLCPVRDPCPDLYLGPSLFDPDPICGDTIGAYGGPCAMNPSPTIDSCCSSPTTGLPVAAVVVVAGQLHIPGSRDRMGPASPVPCTLLADRGAHAVDGAVPRGVAEAFRAMEPR